MNALRIEETSDSPLIILNPPDEFVIQGKSFPEDCTIIYNPVIDWLERYKASDANEDIKFSIFLSYISSTSSLSLIKLLKILKSINEASGSVKIIWRYELDDDDIRSLGEKYEKVLAFPFEYEEVK